MKKIKIDFDYADTEVELKDIELLSLTGRENKGEKGASLCVKDGMNFEIATISTGDLESSNALCNEIVRRFNNCPGYIKGNVNVTHPLLSNYIAQHYKRNGNWMVNLIRKDLNVIISMELDDSICRVYDINAYPEIKADNDNIRNLLVMIAYYASEIEGKQKLLIPRFPLFYCSAFNILDGYPYGMKDENEHPIYKIDLVANKRQIRKMYELNEHLSRM